MSDRIIIRNDNLKIFTDDGSSLTRIISLFLCFLRIENIFSCPSCTVTNTIRDIFLP